MVNLLHLQLFVTIVDRGSFSVTAQEYNMTQPAVSQHIRSLEEDFKVKLFNRYGPRFELTEAGQRLLEVARPLVQQAQRVEETFNARLGEVRGRVNLVYTKNTVAALYLLPPLLAEFHLRHSGVRFNLAQTSEENALALLLERDTHFAILSSPPRQKSLESFLLQTNDLVLVLPPGHAWHETNVSLEALSGQPFLLRSVGSQTRRMTEAALRASGHSLADLQLVAEFDCAEGVVLAAQAGLGMGLATQVIAERYAAQHQVGMARLVLTPSEQAAGIELKHELHVARLAAAPTVEHAPSQEYFWEFLRTKKLTEH
jgi:DNA-binding transcriptional LysR family regulator